MSSTLTDTAPRFLADYRPADFTINTVDLTINLDDTCSQVISELTIKRQGDNQQALQLNGEQLTLVSLALDNHALSNDQYQLNDTILTIPASSLPDNENFTLSITTEINPQENTALEGLFKSGDAFCTQCEAEGFRRISYYLDRPDVMATFTTKVIADKSLYPYLLSNGNKVDSGDLTDNKHFVTWHDPYPKPCYLFALVAGDFDLLENSFTTASGREVALEIFVDKGNLAKAKHAMVSLQKSMKWDEETFGLEYDLDIYMIVAVDFFNMGAMENKGLNVFNSKYVLADSQCATDSDYFNIEAVIAHEYFHNWTGNRVTCRDWFQLSLKEGLTVFRDQQFSAQMHSSAVTRIQNVRLLRSQQFAEDAGPMAHPIRPEKVLEMNNFYTLTVYEKGSEVIRMLHTLIGVEKFRKGMDLYFARFDGMAVTCDDFINAMSDASGKDLSQFKLWYSQSGTPVIKVQESFEQQTNIYTLTLSQHSPVTKKQQDPQALHIPIKIELISGNNDKANQSELLELNQAEQSWQFSGFIGKPTLAMLCDFSAPVKLVFEQNDVDLLTIMKKANNSFCRWDAGQKLLMSYVQQLAFDTEHPLPKELLMAINEMLTSAGDRAFIAEQLSLPSFDEAASLMVDVEPIALSNALSKLSSFIAQGCQQELLASYEACQQERSTNDTPHSGVANRALKNVCLAYLSILPKYQALVTEQYQHATDNEDIEQENMTDSLAALTCSAKHNLADLNQQLQHFEKKWHQTTLVMDKWFALNAGVVSDDIFSRLDTLLAHQQFSLNNPNRARSLIGAFAMNNPKYFHCQTGRGYQFLSKQIAKLNEINPQVASRLITPLIQYKSFAPAHQKLMKAELVNLQALANLSNDLKEKLDAALSD
ncbi:aminopeptidase N [Colwellia psychrerythraea]|uniref:Aminopeptidase N n=1 Tax=Colwellia psychrerythraea TaxID=28229 RepID=A0A099KRI9_COLPS|nr:aminopeptidase N [Colwellia psychrerythraea]KGJ92840.1 aminopeptidase N [Colwellia psychrerythraea]